MSMKGQKRGTGTHAICLLRMHTGHNLGRLLVIHPLLNSIQAYELETGPSLAILQRSAQEDFRRAEDSRADFPVAE